MYKNINKLSKKIQVSRNSIEYNVEPYKNILQEINTLKLNSLTDSELRSLSMELKTKARSGVSPDGLLVHSFALVRETSKRVLGVYPYDVQVIAGIALHNGKMVEMQTGEGKTLAAVMPAFLNALEGNGVHILTFNDYLARRDAQWMGPVYEFLGLSVAYINEGMQTKERQQAYSADITYVTAKEAGFDYLRDFLCFEKEEISHRSFNYAIVDEADSILIDEARIPLVIAGNVNYDDDNASQLASIIRSLKQDQDYEIDQYEDNAYFTDLGLTHLEEMLKCGNLYAEDNLELLSRLNCALFAETLVKKNKDYIVRNGKVELVDEFTGRVAIKRNWPDKLQAAIEAKEGLISETKGVIMGSIALQHFLSLYPKICGMTGTASTAASEFKEFYNLDVVVIPTNKPLIRKDHPDMIFANKAAKHKALIAEIKRVHETGQPILIGSGSVEESEVIASGLNKEGISCQVLNAKNDEMEAKIISEAGKLGSVIVSTNMAGRGVDIKLGGDKEENRDKIVALGGLCILATNHYESRRIDNQLRGRAGRQGDPGESKFFICLEDDLSKKFEITKMIPSKYIPDEQEGLIDNPSVKKAVMTGQRFAEGYNSDLRRQLWRYSYIVEQQRRIIHSRRQDILLDKVPLDIISSKEAGLYNELRSKVGEEVLRKVEKQITLYHINSCWADYLDFIGYQREGVHLVAIGKKDPLTEFHRIAIDAFNEMMDIIDSKVITSFKSVNITENGIDVQKEGIQGPSSTWTYIINENPDQFSRIPALLKASSTMVKGSLFTIQSIYRRILGKKSE